MTEEELFEEANRLTRPCVHLRADARPGAFAGWWKRAGAIPVDERFYAHLITVACRYLPPGVGPSTGCLSLYERRLGGSCMARHDPWGRLPRTADGVKLYAHPKPSLPPLAALHRFGSPALKDWLAAAGWDPEWGEMRKEPKPVRAYLKAYRQSCPLADESIYAVLGGWNIPWPDGDWEALATRPLVLWTLADAEPWFEVFHWGTSFKVKERVT